MRKNLHFLPWLFGLALLLGCSLPNRSTANSGRVAALGQRSYRVLQQITLANTGNGAPEKQNLWVALIGDFAPYQTVEEMKVTPATYTPVTDEQGNHYAEFDFSGQAAGTSAVVQIDYRVTVYELGYTLEPCAGALPREYILPELHIESANPQITGLAKELAQGKATPCEEARAFYDYAGDHLTYADNSRSWGAQAALGPMGADCTEYADLTAALSRARGIPARYFEGLLYAEQTGKIEHAWLDVYLPETGWTFADPTLGSEPARRETYFAHATPDHIIVTLGASPSVLRGSSYWTHLYWPGDSTKIQVSGAWEITPVD